MIKTQRLAIRPWRAEDASLFLDLTQDEGFTAFPINNYHQTSVESARAWIEKQTKSSDLGKWAVWEGDQLVGMGGLTPWEWEGEKLVDITYRLHSSSWGRGLGKELAQGLVRFGFEEKKLDQITATITPDNVPSRKLAEGLGFVFDRHILLLGVPTDLFRLKRIV